MSISILDDSISVEVFFEETDCDFEDNICISLIESCPDEEKIFIHDETNIYLTPDQAQQLAQALNTAAAASRRSRAENCP